MATSSFNIGDTEGSIKSLSDQMTNIVQVRLATSASITIQGNKYADVNFTIPSAFTNNPKAYVIFNQGSSIAAAIALRSWSDATHFNARIYNYDANDITNATLTMAIIGLG